MFDIFKFGNSLPIVTYHVSFNQLLAVLCNGLDVTFVNNDKNFKYQDGSTDESVLLPGDNLHLSSVGAKRLLTNLGLESVAKCTLGEGNRWKKGKDQKKTAPKGKPTPPPPPPPEPEDYAEPQKKKPVYFRGGKDALSNFHNFSFNVYGKEFKSLEHAYQWRKAATLNQWGKANDIRYAASPAEAKQVGDTIDTRSTKWDSIKQSIMYDLLKAKSRQCPAMAKALRDSGDADLIEDTNNAYWARGRDGNGLNMLGQLLMTLGEEVSHEYTPNKKSPTQSAPYRAPVTDSKYPCFQCGEGNHTKDSCRHTGPLVCHSCHYSGHKLKHCPNSTY